MNPVRINYNKCEEQSFLSFIKNIDKSKAFKFHGHNPADESVAQDRYTYIKNNKRVSIVYETKAQTLVITAPEAVIGDVTALVPMQMQAAQQQKSDEGQRVFVREQLKETVQQAVRKDDQSKNEKYKPQEVKKQSAKSNAKQNGQMQKNAKGAETKQVGVGLNQKPAAQPTEAKQKATKTTEAKQKATQTTEVKQKAVQPTEAKQKATKPTEAKQKATKTQKKVAQEAERIRQESKSPERQDKQEIKSQANTFIIKKVAEDRFNELLKKIKANKSMRYKGIPAGDGIRAYAVSSSSEKATVKYVSGDVQLIGNRGDLYSELQLMMSQVSDYKTAIKSHIKFSGEEKRAQDIERQLRKKLPDAFEFLSEHSKIDLAIGLIDINNSAVVLSDYSTLLIPCFRGLERLIFDLQHAQGIAVKMIGQAYEKEDGSHVLKFAYRRKIPSVIYAEVMAALYAEYYKHRNFYAHSDGGYDNLSRVITDKQQVQSIFNHIMAVINYNGKKLKEIGFRIK